MVISGGNFKPDTLKPKEVVSLLLDDEEIEAKCKWTLSGRAGGGADSGAPATRHPSRVSLRARLRGNETEASCLARPRVNSLLLLPAAAPYTLSIRRYVRPVCGLAVIVSLGFIRSFGVALGYRA